MSISKITQAFERSASEQRAALIPYIAASNPVPASTVPLMHHLVSAGADVIELGVPFSDPMADGPVIQRAAEHAIRQGTGLKDVLGMVAEFRQTDQVTPIVLMGYANPIERMGQEAFVAQAAKAGVDGVLVVDYPPEEAEPFVKLLDAHDMAPIFLLAPTSTSERIAAVGDLAKGYVYYVSLRGVTGAGHLNTDEVASQLAKIRQHVKIPVGVGFGISDADSASRVAEVADAVVIGSKLIDVMNQAWHNLPEDKQTDAAVTAGHDWLKHIRLALEKVTKQAA